MELNIVLQTIYAARQDTVPEVPETKDKLSLICACYGVSVASEQGLRFLIFNFFAITKQICW
jgi:hypothetical protein